MYNCKMYFFKNIGNIKRKKKSLLKCTKNIQRKMFKIHQCPKKTLEPVAP